MSDYDSDLHIRPPGPGPHLCLVSTKLGGGYFGGETFYTMNAEIVKQCTLIKFVLGGRFLESEFFF